MSANKTNRRKGGETAGQETKVLLFDLEISPNIGFTWGKWEQNVIEFLEERYIISVAWKWLGEKSVSVRALCDFPGRTNRARNVALVRWLHGLMEEADIVVAHNGGSFDDKQALTEFAVNGLTPPPPHRVVDTLKAIRTRFRLNSNSLDDACARFNLGRKMKHGGFQLWLDCLANKPGAWRKMKAYNKHDVVLLERLYLFVRPWMTNHPSMTALDQHDGCPLCRSKNLRPRGWGLVGGARRRRFVCPDCGKWSSGVVVNQEWRFK